MRCDTVRKKLDRAIRQELAPRLRESVEAHLRECEDCRRHLARQERLAVVLMSVPEPPAVPEGFGDRLMAAAQQRKAASRPVPRLRRRIGRRWPLAPFGTKAAQVAAIAGGLLLGVAMGQQTWPSVHSGGTQDASQADPLAAYELGYLGDTPGGSLAQSYLILTAASNDNGT